MEINEFISDFATILEDVEASELTPATRFRELDEWDSLEALAVLNMVAKKYDVKLPIQEMKQTQTLQELYDLIQSKR